MAFFRSVSALSRLRSRVGQQTPSYSNTVLGGMRGMTAMVWLGSAVEGIRLRGMSIPECHKTLPGAFPGVEPLPEAVLWLLLTGKIPSKEQVDSLAQELRSRATIPAAVNLGRRIGTAVTERLGRKQEPPWHNSLMAAASRAVAERIPAVYFVVHVRDARIPLSSECHLLRNYTTSSKQIVALNKSDLACSSALQAWTEYFAEKNCVSCGVNAHNKDSIRKLLSLTQGQVRKLGRTDHANYTATVMLIGIPNVGKSALLNALHQVGRISTAEKGKLKHATVSPEPGETKDIPNKVSHLFSVELRRTE